jgi:hypothetical protein
LILSRIRAGAVQWQRATLLRPAYAVVPDTPQNHLEVREMLRAAVTLSALLAVDAVPETKAGKVQVYIMM